MHTVIRRYHLDDGDMNEAMHRLDVSLADKMAHEPGFVAYECAAMGEDGIFSITTFQNEEGCTRSNELAAEFVRTELSDMKLSPLGTDSGEVMVSRAAREMLEPAHA